MEGHLRKGRASNSPPLFIYISLWILYSISYLYLKNQHVRENAPKGLWNRKIKCVKKEFKLYTSIYKTSLEFANKCATTSAVKSTAKNLLYDKTLGACQT